MKQNISIVLFAYNRPSHLRRVLIALENRGIDELNLFVDGPKNNNDKIIQKEIKQIFDNNKYNSKMKKNIFYSKRNKGLAKSIIKGITHVAKKRKYILKNLNLFQSSKILNPKDLKENLFIQNIFLLKKTKKKYYRE